jgi:hypothetical protein
MGILKCSNSLETFAILPLTDCCVPRASYVLEGRRGIADGFSDDSPDGEPGHRQEYIHGHQRRSSSLFCEAEGRWGVSARQDRSMNVRRRLS